MKGPCLPHYREKEPLMRVFCFSPQDVQYERVSSMHEGASVQGTLLHFVLPQVLLPTRNSGYFCVTVTR